MSGNGAPKSPMKSLCKEHNHPAAQYHCFDIDLVCQYCKKTWSSQQREPTVCYMGTLVYAERKERNDRKKERAA